MREWSRDGQIIPVIRLLEGHRKDACAGGSLSPEILPRHSLTIRTRYDRLHGNRWMFG